ncbi:MAG: LacI family DNA-binding transcriptional regulator [Clostridium sp.]|nr:LacI family DNA-binding transcriptional regulator [Clostridium sp.]
MAKETNKLTINDIAIRAKTSKTTVSFYLNGKFEKMSPDTRRRIEQVIEETNYSPNIMARSLKSKKSSLIGVIVADITNPFSNNIVKGIDDIARKKDYQILVGSSNLDIKNEEKYIKSMNDMGVDGFIVQPTVEFYKIAKRLKKIGKKIVYLDSVSKEIDGKWVKTNSYEIAHEAIIKLHQKGYEEFILVTENPNILMVRMERRDGFIEAVNEVGAKSSIVVFEDEESYKDMAKILLSRVNTSKKTAIFAINGKMLQKVFRAVTSIGWNIPNQVGIIGFDNWDWTFYATPSVTTIDQPTYQEGKYAAKLLIEMVEESENISESMIFNCSINWNESTNLKID